MLEFLYNIPNVCRKVFFLFYLNNCDFWMKCFRFVLKNIRFWILNGTDDTPHTHTRAMLTLVLSRGVSHGWYLNTSCSQARPPC